MKWMYSLAVCSGLLMCLGCEESSSKAVETVTDVRPRVRVCRVTDGVTFEDAVRIQGSVRTKYTASVASRLPGTVDAVMADEGDVVKAGQSLFQVDRVNLENQLAIAKDDEAVAAAALQEAVAAESETLAALEKAERDAARYQKLFEAKATTADALETTLLQLKRAQAVCERAKAAVSSAQARILQTATARRIAEKNLADSSGVAPFDGIITRKVLDRGDYAGAGDAIFEMDDPRVREACFQLSADRYADVTVGKTMIETHFGQTCVVTYKAPTVHPVSRTFEIRAVLKGDASIAPGMLCNARIIFDAHTGAAVPVAAVGLRNGQRVVFIVDEAGVVQATPITCGATAGAYIEVLNPEVLTSAKIVSEGMLLLNPGDQVKAVEAE